MKKKIACFLILGTVGSQLMFPVISHASELNNQKLSFTAYSSKVNLSQHNQKKNGIISPDQIHSYYLSATWEYNPEKINRYFIGNDITIFNSGITNKTGEFDLYIDDIDASSNIFVECTYSDGSNIIYNLNSNNRNVKMKSKNLIEIVLFNYNNCDLNVLKIKQNFSLETNEVYRGKHNQFYRNAKKVPLDSDNLNPDVKDNKTY